jgi:hypothetical protein
VDRACSGSAVLRGRQVRRYGMTKAHVGPGHEGGHRLPEPLVNVVDPLVLEPAMVLGQERPGRLCQAWVVSRRGDGVKRLVGSPGDVVAAQHGGERLGAGHGRVTPLARMLPSRSVIGLTRRSSPPR